jgi:hypothetical protein
MLRSVHGAAVLGAVLIAPALAAAQPVLLEIRPTPGDTLHLRLDQTVEMTGTTRVGARDSTMTMSTSMAILARAIILGADSAGARVLTVTDSVSVSGSPPQDPKQERSYRDLEGSRVEMRVLPDGSSQIVSDPATLTNELRSLVAQIPATLPAKPVQVGERWSRVVTVPIQAQGGIATTASLKTTFRFDSLSRNKEIAYVSLLGELSRTAMDSASGESGRPDDRHDQGRHDDRSHARVDDRLSCGDHAEVGAAGSPRQPGERDAFQSHDHAADARSGQALTPVAILKWVEDLANHTPASPCAFSTFRTSISAFGSISG